jgi:UDP-glucose 4-epimerase
VGKARDLIGFDAKVDLEEGLKKTAIWIAENEGTLPQMSNLFKN